MKKNHYEEEICPRCLYTLEAGEPPEDMSIEEFEAMQDTLSKWASMNYVPVSAHPDEQYPFFSNDSCALCDALPGDRVEYIFEQIGE